MYQSELMTRMLIVLLADWLSKTYAQGNKKVAQSSTQVMVNEEAKARRASTVASDFALPCSPDQIESWTFDVLQYDQQQLITVFCYIFSVLDIFDEFKFKQETFRTFLSELSNKYLDNTYHNYKHGFDVAHTVYRILNVSQLNLILVTWRSSLSWLLWAMMWGIRGNNAYLIKAKNELALAHNDRSPLENMHCAVLYQLLGKAETIFSQV